MARILRPEVIDDDKTEIKLYIAFNKKQTKELIEELNKIVQGKSDDDYIVIQGEEERFEIELKLER